MKKIILATILILFFFPSFTQDAKRILRNSFIKCNSINNGYYQMTEHKKWLSEKDTTKTYYDCYFKKQRMNFSLPVFFHSRIFWDSINPLHVMYTANEYVSYFPKDSSGRIISKSLWPKEAKLNASSETLYSPLANPSEMSMEFVFPRKYIFKSFGEESINGDTCYHIQVNKKNPDQYNDGFSRDIRIEYHYWISKKDSIPIQYSIAIDLATKKDTEYQYQIFKLKKYELNNLKDENIVTIKSVPSFIRLKDYAPYKAKELLTKDSLAPNWKFVSLDNKKISLTDLRGQLVIIDFFYKGCYFCNLAMPGLQSLNEKYKSKGLNVIGIDPVDNKETELSDYLKKQGITYTILFGGSDVAEAYQISGYPTVYLIDKNGRIIYTSSGYTKESEKELEEIIKKNLNIKE